MGREAIISPCINNDLADPLTITMNFSHNLKKETRDWYQSGYYFDWSGSQVFYKRMGSGPTLLMVHGFPTAGCDWLKMAQWLGHYFTLIVPDIADAGNSRNPGRLTYTLHQHADMLEVLMSHLNISTLHLVGHDVGDAICQELVARQNTGQLSFTVESCLFLNGGILMSAHRPLGLQSKLAGKFGWLVAQVMRKKTFLANVQAVIGQNKLTDQELNEIWTISKGINGRSSLARRSHNMIDRHQYAPRWVKALTETTIPMTMVNGIEDPISGSHACDAIEAQLPNVPVVRLPGIGHFPLLEAPSLCVEHLLDFHRRIGTLK